MEDSANSLAHCQWNCKYHIVFAPKYRRKAIYDKIKVDIGQILRKLCKWKGVEIIEAELCPDHVHMLVKIPPKYSVSMFMGYLKGKNMLMIFDKHANLKYKYGRRQFWCEGYSYGREKHKEDSGVHKESIAPRCRVRANVNKRIYRPVYGRASRKEQIITAAERQPLEKICS